MSSEGMRQHTSNAEELTRLIDHLWTDHGVSYQAERDLVRVQNIHADEHAALLTDAGDPPPIPAAGWDELDYSGAFDGFNVYSDADPGL
jgi:hypothetical protein